MSKPSLSTLPAQSFRLVLSAMATSCLAFGLLAGCAGDTEEKLIASARAYEAKREFYSRPADDAGAGKARQAAGN